MFRTLATVVSASPVVERNPPPGVAPHGRIHVIQTYGSWLRACGLHQQAAYQRAKPGPRAATDGARPVKILPRALDWQYFSEVLRGPFAPALARGVPMAPSCPTSAHSASGANKRGVRPVSHLTEGFPWSSILTAIDIWPILCVWQTDGGSGRLLLSVAATASGITRASRRQPRSSRRSAMRRGFPY